MPKATLNGVTLNYQRGLGDGADLVLVHGLATNLAFWYIGLTSLVPYYYRVTSYDLRGHGRSDMPPRGYTTADMSADLEHMLDYLGADRIHLVGHSFGGTVALHFAALHPERVASLTLADARVRSMQPNQYLKDWPNAELWQKRLKKLIKEMDLSISLDEPEMGYRLLEVLAEAKLRRRDSKSKLLTQFSPFGLSRMSDRTAQRWLELIRTTTARQDFQSSSGLTQDMIRNVRQPVLAIYGEYSNCILSCRGLSQTLPTCRVVIVPRAGHFHPIARSAFFRRTLLKFLREVSE